MMLSKMVEFGMVNLSQGIMSVEDAKKAVEIGVRAQVL